MTESNLQQDLSACTDGELSADALRFLLRRMDHDSELVASWSRYQLMGASLRREQGRLASADFAQRVMLAVQAEPATMVTEVGSGRRWLRWSVGGAIAASVAVAALVTSQPGGPQPQAPQVAAVSAGASDAAIRSSAPTQLAAVASPDSRIGAPAQVPAWLSGYSASQLSQRASATLGGPSSDALPEGLRYRTSSSYPAIRNGNGSYLILLDPNAPNRRSGSAVGAQ